jgi:hypothetical protein
MSLQLTLTPRRGPRAQGGRIQVQRPVLALGQAQGEWRGPCMSGTDRQQRDYVPGVGDCVDLAILAIGWDKGRARELRGALSAGRRPSSLTSRSRSIRHDDTLRWRPDQQDASRAAAARPAFRNSLSHIVWHVETAAGRAEQRAGPASVSDPKVRRRKLPGMFGGCASTGADASQGLSYRFTMRGGMPNPCAMFLQPLNAEIVGAGFQKIPLSNVSPRGRLIASLTVSSTTSCGGRDYKSFTVQQNAHGLTVSHSIPFRSELT